MSFSACAEAGARRTSMAATSAVPRTVWFAAQPDNMEAAASTKIIDRSIMR
ncbi:hypothetical protein GCM10011393_22240 [Sphingopyxis bauzanensis]|nr:hypothetical protein GCM10011393_22240 [Sphingopyxis bauzanensis]